MQAEAQDTRPTVANPGAMTTHAGGHGDLARRNGAEGVDLEIPDGEEPRRCPFCDYPFRTERLRTLHLGVAHEDELDEATRERYEDELDDETHDLFTLHVKLTIAIMLLYFSLSYAYMFVWL